MNFDPKTLRIRRAVGEFFKKNPIVYDFEFNGSMIKDIANKTQSHIWEVKAVVERMRWHYREIENVDESRYDRFELTSKFDPDRKEKLESKRVCLSMLEGEHWRSMPISVMAEDNESAMVRTKLAFEWLVNNFDDIKTSTDKNMGCDFDAE